MPAHAAAAPDPAPSKTSSPPRRCASTPATGRASRPTASSTGRGAARQPGSGRRLPRLGRHRPRRPRPPSGRDRPPAPPAWPRPAGRRPERAGRSASGPPRRAAPEPRGRRPPRPRSSGWQTPAAAISPASATVRCCSCWRPGWGAPRSWRCRPSSCGFPKPGCAMPGASPPARGLGRAVSGARHGRMAARVGYALRPGVPKSEPLGSARARRPRRRRHPPHPGPAHRRAVARHATRR